jgi:hypothetical protein
VIGSCAVSWQPLVILTLTGSGISQRKVESEYGERIMKMMGYGGGGLGATGDGRLEPVQVGRMEDNEGVRFKFCKISQSFS